jgi:hypothetical protein
MPTTFARLLLAVAAAAAAAAGCNGNGHADAGAADLMHPAGPFGGPDHDGGADTHCVGLPAQPTSQAVCMVRPDMAGAPDDGGVATATSVYGPTMFGTEGDDDDCKYHLRFTVTPVYENYPTTFVVMATNKTDGSPAVGGNVDAEVYLDDTHPAPNAPTTTSESPPGTYTIGPVFFDAPGVWTVRFHLYGNCFDLLPNSPHGHAAFYLDVP